jgi:hypothetical protein
LYEWSKKIAQEFCFREAKKNPHFCFIVAKTVRNKKRADLAGDVGAIFLYY